MVRLGDVLIFPEKGWRRVFREDVSLQYYGSNWSTVSEGYRHTTNAVSSIEFKFYGTKLRLLSMNSDLYSDGTIIIDGVSYEYLGYNPEIQSVIAPQVLFEITGLTQGVHVVRLISKANRSRHLLHFGFDVDENGYFVTYGVESSLTQPEAGWKRYDEQYPTLKYVGTWNNSSNSNYYNSTSRYTNEIGSYIEFKFIGDRLRLIGWLYNTSSSVGNDNISIEIDGEEYVFSNVSNVLISDTAKAILFEIIGLENKTHHVKIINNQPNNSNLITPTFYLDAIDINEDGRLIHPNEVISVDDLEVGKYIRCHYGHTQNNEVGVFSRLGEEIYITGTESDFLPTSSPGSPEGDFYFIMVDRDRNGNPVLVADRNIHSLTWEVINKAGFITGNYIDNEDNLSKGIVVYSQNISNSTLDINSISLIEYNNELYALWAFAGSGGNRGVRGKKLSKNRWVNIDNGQYLNYTTSYSTNNLKSIVFKNELYIVWDEQDRIRLKKFNGVGWVSADGNQGLNYKLNSRAIEPFPIVYNNELYVFWSEVENSYPQIRAKKLTENGWVSADNERSLNYNLNTIASSPTPIVYNNELYVFWTERSNNSQQIRAKKLTENGWVSADNGQSLNYSVNQYAYNQIPIVYKNKLYLTWDENGKIRVKCYNSNQWVSVDNEQGINYNFSHTASTPKPVIYNNELYIIWIENNQLRTKKLTENGWISADNEKSLNFNTSYSSKLPTPFVFNNQLYIGWVEQDSRSSSSFTYFYFRIKKYGRQEITSLKHNFIIRLLSGGISSIDKENEWDDYIVSSDLNGTITPGDSLIWNIKNDWSWTSTTISGSNVNKVIRGGSTPTGYNNDGVASYRGFRPVLVIEQKTINKILMLYNGRPVDVYNVGYILEGQESKIHKLTLRSLYLEPIEGVMITQINQSHPDKSRLLFSLTEDPFEGLDRLVIDQELTYGDEVDFYIKVATEVGMRGVGEFSIQFEAVPK